MKDGDSLIFTAERTSVMLAKSDDNYGVKQVAAGQALWQCCFQSAHNVCSPTFIFCGMTIQTLPEGGRWVGGGGGGGGGSE